jgi:hypothetical protein
MLTAFWSENLKVRDHSKGLEADGKVILEWIVGKYGGKLWVGFIWLRIVGCCEHGNEPSCYVKCGNLLTS